MDQLVRDIVSALEDVVGLDKMWHRGVVHVGGPHYRLRGTLGPVSLGEDECLTFGRLIEHFRPKNCFIIGNAFGMSSVYIAKIMEQCGGTSVITLDSMSEGHGNLCAKTAEAIKDRMDARILANKAGWSPQDIAKAADDESYDLIFIDGDHSHPQVTKDFEGVKPIARDDSILCWHDYWMKGVPESVDAAIQAGYLCHKINTSCEMVFGTKDETIFQQIKEVFPRGEKPVFRKRRLAWMKLYYALFVGKIKIRMLGQRAADLG